MNGGLQDGFVLSEYIAETRKTREMCEALRSQLKSSTEYPLSLPALETMLHRYAVTLNVELSALSSLMYQELVGTAPLFILSSRTSSDY